MKRIIIHLTAIMVVFTAHGKVFSQDDVDSIIEADKSRQTTIIMKNLEHQRKILEKINKFFEKVRKFAPDMKLQTPVHPGYADNVKDTVQMSGFKKLKAHFAYLSEPYMLRSGPSDRDSKNVSKVPRGARVQVLMMPKIEDKAERKNVTQKWVLVRTPAKDEGYVPLDLLLAAPPAKDHGFEPMVKGSMSDVADTTKKMKVIADSLNVRSEPGMESSVVDKIRQGAIVDILTLSDNTEYIDGKEAKWAKIRYRYIEGWVFSGYLSEDLRSQEEIREPIQDFAAGQRLYVKSDLLRVRDAPSDEGTVLFSLRNRDRVEVTDVQNEVVSLAGKKSRWIAVKYSDYDGWVFGAFLSRRESDYEEGDDIDKMFIFPFNDPSLPITSNFGWRMLQGSKNYHGGVDIGAARGTPILATADGTVVLTKIETQTCNTCGYGTYAIVEHRNGYRSLYGHMSELDVRDGQKVLAGDKLGKVGNTGHSFGCHLHFEIRGGEEYIDPLTYLHAVLDDVRDACGRIALYVVSFFSSCI